MCAVARNYAALPHEYLEEMELYSDEEFGRLCRALLRYSATGEIPELTGQERFAWQRVRAQEERFQASYEEIAAKRSRAGKSGAAARWNGSAIANDGNAISGNASCGNTETKINTNTDIPLPSEGGDMRKEFAPPTLEEVAAYVAKRGSAVDPQGFIDFYASKGWTIGKTPMKDWKAACRNAEHWDRWKQQGAKGGGAFAPCGAEDTTGAEDVRRMERYLERLRRGEA